MSIYVPDVDVDMAQAWNNIMGDGTMELVHNTFAGTLMMLILLWSGWFLGGIYQQFFSGKLTQAEAFLYLFRFIILLSLCAWVFPDIRNGALQ